MRCRSMPCAVRKTEQVESVNFQRSIVKIVLSLLLLLSHSIGRRSDFPSAGKEGFGRGPGRGPGR